MVVYENPSRSSGSEIPNPAHLAPIIVPYLNVLKSYFFFILVLGLNFSRCHVMDWLPICVIKEDELKKVANECMWMSHLYYIVLCWAISQIYIGHTFFFWMVADYCLSWLSTLFSQVKIFTSFNMFSFVVVFFRALHLILYGTLPSSPTSPSNWPSSSFAVLPTSLHRENPSWKR